MLLRNLLLVLAALAGLSIILAALHWLLPDAARFKDLAGSAQSLVTALAILLGGGFAAVKLELFRDFAPHLTIDHAVSHRRVGDSYVHIAVKATLHNSSRVKVELREGFFLLQQVSPTADAAIESLYDEVFVNRHYDDFQWPSLDEVERRWEKDESVVEPGGTHQELCEFIVSADIETVLIYTFFSNARFPQSSPSQGWEASTVYDIIG